MNFTEGNSLVVFEERDDKADKLRLIERLENAAGRKTEFKEWHFKLLQELDPYHIKFYTQAIFDSDTIWFNALTPAGRCWYDYARQNHRDALLKIFGDIRVALAGRGNILHSFKTKKEVLK